MVTTTRLVIMLLTYRQLVAYLNAGDMFEDEMALLKNGRFVNAEVKDRVEKFTMPFMKNATHHDYLFYTFWIVVDKAANCIVAELGFKGLPNDKGEIEIGYGTMPGHQGKGYMTEAVGGMINWAASQPGINSILAETDENNLASIRIVQKNGFGQVGKKGRMLWWRKDIVHHGVNKPAGQ